MTRLSLRTLRLRPGQELRDEVPVALEPFELGGQRYHPVPSEPRVEVTIARATSGDVFRLRAGARLVGPCVRCLEDAVVELDLDGLLYEDASPDADEQLHSEYVVDGELDLGSWLRDLVAEALPEQIVCRPDCGGLCAVCGLRVEGEPHDHGERPPDPRWAGLEGLLGSP